jgi:putative sterol carrier protein
MSKQSHDLLPTSIVEAIEGMAARLDPDEAKDLKAVIQFKVSPSATLEKGGDYTLSIANGTCEFATGTTPDPTLTISTPADVWLKIARKELNGALALMTGKYKARGQMSLLLKMDSLFSRRPPEAGLAAKH